MPKPGLYANIQAKRERIASGSGERMRKPGEKGAPSKADFDESAKTAKVGLIKGAIKDGNKENGRKAPR
jgi:hypothetical protein